MFTTLSKCYVRAAKFNCALRRLPEKRKYEHIRIRFHQTGKKLAPQDVKHYSTSEIINEGSISPNNDDETTTMNEYLNRLQTKLLSFIDVAVNSNMSSAAFESLRHYHTLFLKHETMLNDIRLYNTVLEGFAAEGNWSNLEVVLEMFSDANLKPNLQTFVYAIECAYRAENYHAITRVLDDIKTRGFDIRNIFVECNFVRDQRKIVLKAITSQISSFKPKKIEHFQIHKCKLLENLNTDILMERSYYPLGTCLSSQKLMALAKEQLELEKRGFMRLTSIDCTPDMSDEKTKLINKLLEYETKFKSDMSVKFQAEVDNIRSKNEASDGEIDILPYLCCMEPTEFVDLIYTEYFLAQRANSFAYEMSNLPKFLGLKVMEKYLLRRKMKNGVLEQMMKLYAEYCDFLVNPELTLRYSSRQYWELLKEKYSDGPDIETREEKWPKKVIEDVGKVLFTVIKKTTELDANLLGNRSGKRKKAESSSRQQNIMEIKNNSDFKKNCKRLTNGTFALLANNLPMLCPPVPWNSVSSGGYLLNHKFSLLRTANVQIQNHFRKTDSHDLFPCFDSLNHIAECPWIINKKVLNTILDVYKYWSNVKSDFSSKAKINTDEQRAAKLLFRTKRALAAKIAKRDLLNKLSIAVEFRERVFWFPHNIDFRGRAYSIPTYFHYQLTDVDRGLLLFAKGEPLGTEGLDWLKIQLINLTGERKRCSLPEKIVYCTELLSDIMDSADNPLKGDGWWEKSDNPWQTLACCIELTAALRSSSPKNYVCHFPVHQDGFCNGLQHYAALGRDQKIAEQVNLESSNLPHDLYTVIADKVELERKKDAEAGNQAARFLAGFINRQFVKTPLLTMIYGSSLNSACSPILQQLKEISNSSYEQQLMAAEYLVEEMWPILSEEFSSVLKIQNWFTECGSLITQMYEQPVDWISPLGLPIIQPYIPSQTSNSHSEKEISTKESSIQKQAKSFSSNFIHSLDASHLLLTSLFCRRKGISFVGVHDSFWTHPNYVTAMSKVCREQFVALHSEPLLENLSEHLKRQYSSTSNVDFQRALSKVPSKGTFDLTNVLKSTYFFS